VTIFSENLKHLRRHGKRLVAQVLRPPGFLTIEETSGPSLRVLGRNGWITLHSTHDPVAEAKKRARGIFFGRNDLLIVIGFGFGYYVVELAKKLKTGQNMLVVEREVDIFASAMRCVDLAAILQRRDVVLLVSADVQAISNDLFNLYFHFIPDEVGVYLHNPSSQVYGAGFVDPRARKSYQRRIDRALSVTGAIIKAAGERDTAFALSGGHIEELAI